MSNNVLKFRYLLLAGPMLSVSLAPSHAQDIPAAASAKAAEPDSDDEQTRDIVVTGTRRSLEDALQTKRDSVEVLDSISAEGIGKLPDLNLAEALQRLPGVQINRSTVRRGGTVSIRGLPGDFSQTLLNGQYLASPNVTNFEFGNVRSEAFSGIDVRKSPGAAALTGGLSGLVNLRTGNPLSAPDQLSMNIDSRYEELTKGAAPGGAIVFSKKIVPGVLGVRAALGYRRDNFRQDAFQINTYEKIAGTATPELTDDVYRPLQFRMPSYSSKGATYTASAVVEFKPTSTLSATLRGFYNNFMPKFYESQFLVETAASTTKTALETSSDAFGQTQNNVIYTNPRTMTDSRYNDVHQVTRALTGDLTWENDGWMAQGIVHYTRATRIQDIFGYQIQQAAAPAGSSNGFSVQFNTGAGSLDNVGYTLLSGTPRPNLAQPFGAPLAPTFREARAVAQPLLSIFGGFRNQLETDAETSYQFNLARDLGFGPFAKIEVGGIYRTKFQNQRNPLQTFFGVDLSRLDNSYYNFSMFDGGMPYLGNYAGQIDRNGYAEVDVRRLAAALRPNNVTNLPANSRVGAGGFVEIVDSTAASSTYDNTQDIKGGYAEVSLDQAFGDTLRLRGSFGLRYEKSSRETVSRTLTNQLSTNSFSYDNWLPSSNLVLEIGDKLLVRGSFVPSMRRPQVDSFAVLRSIAADGSGSSVTVNLGASDLKPFVADNYDLAIEWYNRAGSSISITGFKKDVRDYAATTRLCPADGGGFGFGPLSSATGTCRTTQDTPAFGTFGAVRAGALFLVNVTANQSAFTLKGAELSVQQNLSFLPGFLKYFGGQINYTYVDFSSSSSFMLGEISRDTVNSIIYYETPKLSLRVAHNYRSKYLLVAGGTGSASDRFVKARSQLDLSAQFNITGRFAVTAEAFNVTNAIVYEYEGTTKRPRLYSLYGRTFSAGLSYRF